jgi:uncharacterized phiE125 gp8 family phage protein
MNLKLITAPLVEPVTRADLVSTDFLRGVDFDLASNQALFDNYLIPHARGLAEQWLDRKIISQTWELSLDNQPENVLFPFGMLSAVSYVKTMAEDDSATVESNYTYTLGDNARLWLRWGKIWTTTTRPYDVLRIGFICGWANAAAVPAAIKQGILIAVSFFHENRQSVNELPDQAKYAMSGYRIIQVT